MSIELKIKSKHLSVEAKIIRFEEKKLKAKNKAMFWNLRSHRTWEVRNENRATFLARAFLEGRAYGTVEKNVENQGKLVHYIVPRVLSMVNKYGESQLKKEDILNWIAG